MPSERPTRDSGRSVRTLGLLSAVTALFLIAMIAAAIQGAPTFRPSDPAPLESDRPLPTTSPAPTGSPTPLDVDLTSAGVVQVFSVILLVLVVAGIVALVVVIVCALVRAWRDRPLRRRDAADVAAEVETFPVTPEPEVAATTIRRGIAGALWAIDDQDRPSDAVIAAWIGLEESAADAGTRRGASETPGEFAVRIITIREGVAAEATELLRLFERVRFGAHEATEQERDAARDALRRIEEAWR